MADTVVQYVINISADKAERSLDNLSAQSGRASRSMDKLGDESTETARDLDRFSRSSKKADKDTRELSKGLKLTTASISSMASSIGLMVGAVAGAATGIVKFQQHIADLTNELTDASAKSGIAIDTLAGLRLAAEGSGLSFSSLESGLIQFQAKIRDAANGSKEMERAFDDLGVSVMNSNGELRDSDQVFREALRSLSSMTNETERNAVAMKLFGRSAGPALIQSGALSNLDAMSQKAREFGVSINDDAIGAMGDFQRAIADFEMIAIGTFEDILDTLFGNNSVTKGLQNASKAMIFLGAIAKDVLSAIGQAFENIFAITSAWQLVLTGRDKSSISQAFELLKDVAVETREAFSNLGNTIANASEEVDKFNRLSESTETTTEPEFKGTGEETIIVEDTRDPVEGTPQDIPFQTSIVQQLADAADAAIDQFSARFENGLAIGLIDAINPALASVAKVVQRVLNIAIDQAEVLATGSISDIVSVIAPTVGKALGLFAEIGKQTPEERRQELLEEIQAIKAGLEFSPEIFLSVLPEMAIVLTEAVFDGVVNGFVNAIELLRDAFKDLFSFSLFDKPPDEQSGIEKIGSFLADFFNPSKSATFASGGRFIPSAESGIRFTGSGDGLAMLHRGEFVVPQSGQRPQQVDRQLNRSGNGGGVNIVVNSLVTEQNAIDQLVRQIETRFNAQYGMSSSNLFGGR